jgi:hypothetical protein
MSSSRRAALLWLVALLAALCLAGLTAELLHSGWVVSADRSIERHGSANRSPSASPWCWRAWFSPYAATRCAP